VCADGLVGVDILTHYMEHSQSTWNRTLEICKLFVGRTLLAVDVILGVLRERSCVEGRG
jgi:hypothetical protein